MTGGPSGLYRLSNGERGRAMAEQAKKLAFGLDPKKQKIAIAALAVLFGLLVIRLVIKKTGGEPAVALQRRATARVEVTQGDPQKILAELRERPSLQPDRPVESEPLARNPFSVSDLFKKVLLGPSQAAPAIPPSAEGAKNGSSQPDTPGTKWPGAPASADPAAGILKGLVLHAVLLDDEKSIALVNETYVEKGDELSAEQDGNPVRFRVESIRGRAVVLRRLDANDKGPEFVLTMEPPRFTGRIQ